MKAWRVCLSKAILFLAVATAGAASSSESVVVDILRALREAAREMRDVVLDLESLKDQMLALNYTVKQYGAPRDPNSLPAELGYKLRSRGREGVAEGSLYGVWKRDGVVFLDAWRESDTCWARLIVCTKETPVACYLDCSATSKTHELPLDFAEMVFCGTEPACLVGTIREWKDRENQPVPEWWEFLGSAPVASHILKRTASAKLGGSLGPSLLSGGGLGEKYYLEWERNESGVPRIIEISKSFYMPTGGMSMSALLKPNPRDYGNLTVMCAYASRADELPTTVTMTSRRPKKASMEAVIERVPAAEHPLARVYTEIEQLAKGGGSRWGVIKHICKRAGLKMKGGESKRPSSGEKQPCGISGDSLLLNALGLAGQGPRAAQH